MSIPKIIHQTAPTNKADWHPIWRKCNDSWQSQFAGFKHKLWNDQDIDDFVRNDYPEYWEMYQSFPVHIMKIDFVRFCFMHKYGGIYADMDMFCYRNFYSELGQNIYVLENPMGNDLLENSMMVSEPNHPFWVECMNLCATRFDEIKSKDEGYLKATKDFSCSEKARLVRPYFVFYITGTNLISTAVRITKEPIYSLPGILYNNHDMSYHPEYRTKHVHTGLWGEENIKLQDDHSKFKTIPVDEFDFYFDYTGGKFLKENVLDIDKNDNYGQITGELDYEYT